MSTQPYSPMPAGWEPPPPPTNDKKAAVAVGVCVLAVIGTIMSMQSTSLLNGTGSIWLGVVLVGAAVAAAFFLRGATWVKVVAAVLLGLSLFSALYMEHQMTEKRNEIQRDLNSWQQPPTTTRWGS